MSKVALGILTAVLIFIASGCLAVYWIAKMRREMELHKPVQACTQVANPGSVA